MEKNKGTFSLAAAVATSSLAMTLALAACGGPHPSQASSRGSTTTTTAPLPATSTRPSTSAAPFGKATKTTTRATTTTTATTTPGGPPRGGPVPAGFDPVSFTAVSGSEFWLLGEAPCANPVCTSIVRTEDGGRHFVGIPAPTSALDVGNGSAGRINTLRFADALDGYALDTNPGGAFWDTHDGGEAWAQPSFIAGRDLLGFGTGAGYAFALVGSCEGGSCDGTILYRSPVSSDQWVPVSVPVPAAGVGELAAMTVLGPDLWFSLTTSPAQPDQLLVAGRGSGASFTTYQGPCLSSPGGGIIQAVSPEVLWAVCPTGTMAEALRSTDGGAHWQVLSSVPPLSWQPAGALPTFLAPASASSAVLGLTVLGLVRTDDGGATWTAVPAPAGSGSWSWVGFTDPSTGSALTTVASTPPGWPWPQGPSPQQLWRSSDGGATWSKTAAIG